VVGVDDSPRSERALRWAASEAASSGRRLRLIHAFEWPVVYPSMVNAVPVMEPVDMEKAAQALLDRLADQARAWAPGVSVETEAVAGAATQVLCRASEQASLLVVGSHGRGAVARVLLGSVSTALTARAACPVVVVRTSDSGAEQRDRVVVGVDGSAPSLAALGFAAEYAARHGFSLAAVRCWDPVREGNEEPRQQLTDAVASQRSLYPELQVTELVLEGRPADVLVEQSAGAQLLVVGTRGHGTVSGLLLGSVSQGALHHAYCPVAVVHPTPPS